MTQCSQNFNLQVLTPFNKPYFARTCKDFLPVCSSLMCHIEKDQEEEEEEEEESHKSLTKGKKRKSG